MTKYHCTVIFDAPTDFHVFSKAGTSNVTPKGKKK